jgi:hypothetical protein
MRVAFLQIASLCWLYVKRHLQDAFFIYDTVPNDDVVGHFREI